ncbi:hypothetical protein FRC08_013805 [Ceratobasidium sp. 394]|nr:hypothetical protein FRC08_013805 [Ceratobasidium sp. 394]
MTTQAVSIPEVTALRIDAVEEFDSTFHCIVCMNDYPSGQASVIKDCGHIHCSSCWTTYVARHRQGAGEDMFVVRELVCPTCRGKTHLRHVGSIELVGMPKDEAESINKLIEDTIALRNSNNEIAEKCRVLANRYRHTQGLLRQLQDACQSTTEQLMAALGHSVDPMVSEK